MTLLTRVVGAGGAVTFVTAKGNELTTHKPNAECWELGCVIHCPTQSPANDGDWPYNWRENGVMERICPHGVGHPDRDSVNFHKRGGHDWVAIHGCDGCCVT